MKYQPKGRPRGSSSDDGKGFSTEQFISTTVIAATVTAVDTISCDRIHVTVYQSKQYSSTLNSEWLHVLSKFGFNNELYYCVHVRCKGCKSVSQQ